MFVIRVERPRQLSKLNEMPYSRMTIKVALVDIDPEVAVTVTEVCVGADFAGPDEPPHPENRPRPTKPTASSRSKCSRLRFLMPRKQSATARVAGKNGL